MKGRLLRVLSVLFLLAAPLVFYEGLSMIVFFAFPLVFGTIREEHALILTGISGALTAGVLGIVYLIRIRPGYRKRRGRQPVRSLESHLWIFPAAAVSCVAVNILVALLNIQSENYAQVNELLFLPSLGTQLVCMVLVLPLTEELIFRGFAFCGLRSVWTFFPSALGSALYFGIFHGNLPQGIYAFIIGVELAFCCEWFGGVYASWLFHAFANFTSIMLMYVFT